MPDPGFVSGFIGWAISHLINDILGYINRAVRCKQELESLQHLLHSLQFFNSDLQMYTEASNSSRFKPSGNVTPASVDGWLKKLNLLLQEAGEMVRKCTLSCPLISGHNMSKDISVMITKIKEHRDNAALIGVITQLAHSQRQVQQSNGEIIASSSFGSAPPPTQRSNYIGEPHVQQVIAALREFGLESSNLILGIDFTKSNEWTGKHSFNRQNLHAIGDIPNPYEQAISIIGRTLSPFDEDNLIPCFGFGDATTHDHSVNSFFPDLRPCHGFEEALTRYREIVPHLKLAGPTSFAPIIQAAMGIVERTGRQYHVLVIIADGQVTRSSDTPTGCFSPQEQKTIDAIVTASNFPLSIVLVGVGDGPWNAMQNFCDNIPSRVFDNFQFVDFTGIMSKNMTTPEKEAEFALVALMAIPFQYKATKELQLLGRCVGLPPPLPGFQYDTAMKSYPCSTSFQFQPSQGTPHGGSFHEATNFPFQQSQGTPHALSIQEEGSIVRGEQVCPVCLTNPKDMAFGCGHTTCRDCSPYLSTCPICRAPISIRVRLY